MVLTYMTLLRTRDAAVVGDREGMLRSGVG